MYGSPAVLAATGPLLAGSWEVPVTLAQRFQAAGRPVPPPVRGFLLLDTGASGPCIASDVAQELGLKAVGLRKTRGSSGTHDSEVFEATMVVALPTPSGLTLTIRGQNFATGVPDMDGVIDQSTFSTNDPSPKRLIGLIGRDFLRFATLVYRGSTGVVEITIDSNLANLPIPN